LNTDARQGFFDLVELERLYDRLDLLHVSPLRAWLKGTRRQPYPCA
jgi:hypothetical protein